MSRGWLLGHPPGGLHLARLGWGLGVIRIVEFFASLILPLAQLKGRYSPMALVTDPLTKNYVYPWKRDCGIHVLTGMRKWSVGSATFVGRIATNRITTFWWKQKRKWKQKRMQKRKRGSGNGGSGTKIHCFHISGFQATLLVFQQCLGKANNGIFVIYQSFLGFIPKG